ncbi:small acid-soluble spore protein P [Paenibacillus sp.]|jgi:small acid-soluble spore protein P (minor)|uniref:small acid-soluble spore protein P n=1 Tax=Paenibacillus sp. TaxID=58172 RepID=UPI00282B08DF|nr:small acid-soluble spore protein P [Paenibacillus sp.]MDR0270173.1 small acid-soluble spore protein P [Paenibacillus sp.]
MSKPKAIPVPEMQREEQRRNHRSNGENTMQEPLSGSKKVKNRNHVSHLNKEG